MFVIVKTYSISMSEKEDRVEEKLIGVLHNQKINFKREFKIEFSVT